MHRDKPADALLAHRKALTDWIWGAMRFIDLWDSGDDDLYELDADRLTREGYALFSVDLDGEPSCLADLQNRQLVAFEMDVGSAPADRCPCAECAALDRAHPAEGVQLRLIPSSGGASAPSLPHPDAPAPTRADGAPTSGRQEKRSPRGTTRTGAPHP